MTNEQLQELSQVAIQHAQKEFRIALTTSPESLPDLEDALGRLHNLLPKGFLARLLGRTPSEQQLKTLALTYGALLGLMLESRYGGVWSVPETGLYADWPVLEIRSHPCCPANRTLKRIVDGPENDVVNYFYGLGAILLGNPEK